MMRWFIVHFLHEKVSASPVNTSSVTPKPATTTTPPKTITTPKANDKDTKTQDKTSGKNADVKVTKTGIVRQPKKEEPKDKASNQKNTIKKIRKLELKLYRTSRKREPKRMPPKNCR
ncbi:MAG: hypothetical protein HWD58_05520 [Bacteroidota bacterium]|nr:MAG: hypothetical protein HWD58_05520 [Bacteroidota bacterium]